MPPKKKIKTANEAEEPKPIEKVLPAQPKKEEVKVEVKQTQPSQPVPAKPAPIQQPPQQVSPAKEASKITNIEGSNLSEEELLKLRKLRFNVVGTDVSPEEAERLKQERLRKFGGSVAEDQADLERRKLKFGVVGNLNAQEDPSTVQKRLQKFGNSGSTVQTPKETLEQRKKKFGSVGVDLDKVVLKTKPIHKVAHFPKNGNRSRGHPQQWNKFRR